MERFVAMEHFEPGSLYVRSWRECGGWDYVHAAVPPGLGLDTEGSRTLGPLLGLQGEAVQARHFSNPIEFDGIKTGIVDLFPEAEELEGVAVAQPRRVFIGKTVGSE